MHLSHIAKLCALTATAIGLVAVAVCWSPQTANAASQDTSLYTNQVLPVLRTNCYRCHGGMNHRGGLTLDTKAGMLKGGKHGSVIVPGHPEQSLLIKLIRHEGPADDPMPMPPKGKLSDADIATVTQWVQAGAVMPE